MEVDRFHRAAESGQGDVLRQTTKKDCNRQDDVGMTPTLITASKGDMDSLRLLISRGGNADLCDNQGYTALHFAAMNGKLNVVTFLVSFGCNIWALTNDGRNALQLAKENDHHQIADLLDDVYAEQEAKNKSRVQKLRKDAIKEAEERTKKVEKQWKKTLKKEKKLENKQTNRKGQYVLPAPEDEVDAAPVDQTSRRPSASKENKGTKKKSTIQGYPGMYGTQKSVRNKDIQYGKATDIFQVKEPQQPQQAPQIRGPSSFGSLNPFGFSSAMANVLASTTPAGNFNQDDGHDMVDGVQTTFGNSTSPGLDQDYIDEVGDEISTPLELFLAVNELSDYHPIFVEEDIDLKTLMLLNEEDVKQLGLGLGPKKKLLQALENRRRAMAFEKPLLSDTAV